MLSLLCFVPLGLRGEPITWTYQQLVPADEIDRKPYACAGR